MHLPARSATAVFESSMIDPPAPEPLPGLMRTMAGEFGMTFRQAAEVLLLMPTYLKSGDLAGREDGDPEGEAEKAAIRELVQKCRTLPEEALPYLVVKEGMSGLGMFKADSPIVEVAIVKATQRIKAFQHCVKILWGGWGGNDPPARHYRGPGSLSALLSKTRQTLPPLGNLRLPCMLQTTR